MAERAKLMKQYYREYIARPMHLRTPKGQKPQKTPADQGAGQPSDDVFTQVADQLRGFSGREIAKLCMALQTHIFAEAGATGVDKKQNLEVTTEMLFSVVGKKVKEHNKAMRMMQEGYAFKCATSDHGSLPPTP